MVAPTPMTPSRMVSNTTPEAYLLCWNNVLFIKPPPLDIPAFEAWGGKRRSLAMQRVISSPQAYTALQYGPEQGSQSLINFLVEKINREQGLSVQPANLMLVAGTTHAVDMLTRLYARSGEVVLVEAPTYVDAIHIFRDHQVELYAIPTDEDGLIPSELEKQLALLNSS